MAISGIAQYMQAAFNRLTLVLPVTKVYAVWNRQKNLEDTFVVFVIREVGRDLTPGPKTDGYLLLDRPVLTTSFYSIDPTMCETLADSVQTVMHGFQGLLDPLSATTNNMTLVTKSIGSQQGYGFDDKLSRYVLDWEYVLEVTL